MALFRMLKNLREVKCWLAERTPMLRLRTELVPLEHTDGWHLRAEAVPDTPGSSVVQDVSRPDGKFFRVAGAKITRYVDGKTQAWGQPLIAGSKEGFVAFLREKQQGRFLVQLLAEPGNVGTKDAVGANTRVLIASTFQVSPDNVDRAIAAIEKGGDVPPAVARYLPLVRMRMESEWTRICEDGGRFFEKVNGYAFANVASIAAAESLMADAAPDAQDFAWISRSLLDHLIWQGLVNSHGVQAYGVACTRLP